MAASSGSWRRSLNSHPIFDVFKSDSEWCRQLNDSKRLMVIEEGNLYAWNPHNATVLATNLKSMLDSDSSLSFQTLLCSNPPVYEVEELILNPTGQLLALVGRCGVSILQLPQRWGKNSEFSGGKQKILCKTIPIAERFFACETRFRLLQAAWYPGSDTDTHIMLLTSDNCLRIYNLMEPNDAAVTYPLSEGPSRKSVSLASLPIATALGDHAVAFDFGPPSEVALKPRLGVVTKSTEPQITWRVYILWANGDIYMLSTSLDNSRSEDAVLKGPLIMLPPAEDNYGTDACAIRCLPSRPPTLVVATPVGILYHFLVLNGDEDDKETRSEISFKDTTVYEGPPEPTLYLMETVELELSLKTVSIEADEPVEDDYACPIRLHLDANCAERYHCSHSAGVHTVVLPWIPKFQEFSDNERMMSLEMPTLTEEAVVEHLICTKPHPASAASPVLGLCVTKDGLLGATLLCLLSSGECICRPLLASYRSEPPSLLSETTDASQSPLRKLYKEPFDVHIQRILKKSACNPVLKTSQNTDLSPQECFQLLSRATQVFREEYIQKLDMARQEIQRRLTVLATQKDYQLSELESCKEMRNKLTDKAGTLAERYEDAVEKQQQLVDRIETVLRKLQTRLPMLSDAERNMHRELKDLEDKLEVYKRSIQQLKIKKDYQGQQYTSLSMNTSSPYPSSFNKRTQEHLDTVLRNQGDEITNLVTAIGNLKTDIQA